MRSHVLKTLLAGAAVALALAACADGRPAAGCMPDGSPVYYQYPNTSGTYDGTKASPENCKQG